MRFSLRRPFVTDPNQQAVNEGLLADLNDLARLVPDTGGLSLRLRFGKVTAAGAVSLGTGFSSSKSSTGTYVVTVGFANTPVVLATIGEPAGALGCKITAASTTSFTVVTFTTTSGALTDAAFNWTAIG